MITLHITEYPSWKTTCRLFQRGISYVIVGKESLDYTLLMEKLSTQFGIKVLMLDGGGILHWSFIGAGLCDELSVVIAAAADGFSDPPALFETR